jgi:hypothetical protein
LLYRPAYCGDAVRCDSITLDRVTTAGGGDILAVGGDRQPGFLGSPRRIVYRQHLQWSQQLRTLKLDELHSFFDVHTPKYCSFGATSQGKRGFAISQPGTLTLASADSEQDGVIHSNKL